MISPWFTTMVLPPGARGISLSFREISGPQKGHRLQKRTSRPSSAPRANLLKKYGAKNTAELLRKVLG